MLFFNVFISLFIFYLFSFFDIHSRIHYKLMLSASVCVCVCVQMRFSHFIRFIHVNKPFCKVHMQSLCALPFFQSVSYGKINHLPI